MTRRIHLEYAPAAEYRGRGVCIERASYTRQGDGVEGHLREESPTRVAWRVLDGDESYECVRWGWMVSCRTPVGLRDWMAGPRDWRQIPGRPIGDGSDEAAQAWLDADPALMRRR